MYYQISITFEGGIFITIINSVFLLKFVFNSNFRYIQPPTKPLGEALEGYQILKLNNERFTVPEILLRPSNIGMEQQGIAETVVSSILKCPKSRQEVIANNIILAGGNAKFPGLRERIEHDVQHLAPFNWKVKVFLPEKYDGYKCFI